ncbi:hypothetical protein SAMN02982917_6878 [Azospirillum oryzae]|uniref:Uncharacterized protein n=1 Tax=Azospirillum oryzae TaxID=286727 RepID=A0A1X7HNF4_9PROT|nr:hypothetical protein SAMN02982917_6878 [Azospirillum oryzae]
MTFRPKSINASKMRCFTMQYVQISPSAKPVPPFLDAHGVARFLCFAVGNYFSKVN